MECQHKQTRAINPTPIGPKQSAYVCCTDCGALGSAIDGIWSQASEEDRFKDCWNCGLSSEAGMERGKYTARACMCIAANSSEVSGIAKQALQMMRDRSDAEAAWRSLSKRLADVRMENVVWQWARQGAKERRCQ